MNIRYQVYERPRPGGYEETAATASPYLTTHDLRRAKHEANCIAECGLASFVWDGIQCVYDPEGQQVGMTIPDPTSQSLF